MPRRRHGLAFIAAASAPVWLAGCGGSSSSTSGGSVSSGVSSSGGNTLLIALDVPSSADPYVAGYISRGAREGVRQLNADGVRIGGVPYTVVLKTYDEGLDPARSTSNVAAAIHDGAVGIVEDGIGAATSGPASQAAGVPEVVISNGTADLVAGKPSLYRLGIANDAAANVLGSYIGKKANGVAIIHDDTAAGRDGATQLVPALSTASAALTLTKEVPAQAPSVDAEVRAAADSHPKAIAILGTDTFTARVVRAVHDAGITIPLYTEAAGESTTLRQVAGVDATDGVVFIASRTASENDSASFGQFEHRLAQNEGGPIDAGVKDRAGDEIRQPADQEIFSDDAVRLIVAALEKTGSARPTPALLSAMTTTQVTSVNGDHRGFNPDNHEGVADDDLYPGVIHDMQTAPVKDESLAATLPTPDEILAHFH